MSLSCSCDYELEGDPGEWCYWYEDIDFDFSPLKTSKRKRCCSCGLLIDIGAPAVEHPRYRYPYNDIEAAIVGCDWNCEPPIRIASHYHCERCGEIFLNLNGIGYKCIFPGESMEGLLKEYHEMTGFDPKQATT